MSIKRFKFTDLNIYRGFVKVRFTSCFLGLSLRFGQSPVTKCPHLYLNCRRACCLRPIPTSKVDPRTERIKLFIMAVDPNGTNGTGRDNEDIYDDFNLK